MARSLHSVGMESERSAASTNLADVMIEGTDTTAHLDNLVGLNERVRQRLNARTPPGDRSRRASRLAR